MLAVSVDRMKMVLAAMMEAIFVVMGEPNESVRQCPLAMDKWLESIVGPRQMVLGLIIDTDKMTVSIPAKYRREVLQLLDTTWHSSR